MAHPPPQDVFVGRQFINGLDGREAVAEKPIAEGELVLISTPYAVAMIASSAPTALMCAAKAVEGGGNDVSVGPEEDKGESGKRYNAKHKKQRVSQNPNRQPAPSTAASSERPPRASAHFADPAALDTATAFGLKDRPGLVHKNTTRDGSVFRLKNPTFCASCFQSIPSGTVLQNRSQLQDTAVDISVEQMLLQREREEIEAKKREEPPRSHGGQKKGDNEEEGEEEEGDGAAVDGGNHDDAALTAKQRKELKKQKKPAKSAAMKKDGVVALKQRLAAAAAEELELFVESYLMEKTKRDRAEAEAKSGVEEKTNASEHAASKFLLHGGAYWNDAVASISCWDHHTVRAVETATPCIPLAHQEEKEEEEGEEEEAAPSSASSSSCAGCEHCGVLMFCSPHCWHAHREHHASSGECTILRRVHFPLMQTYFAPSSKSLAGTLGQNGGLVPGTEPSRWMSRCNADRELEMHSLLLAALVGGAAAAEGRAERLRDREMVHVLTPSTEESAKNAPPAHPHPAPHTPEAGGAPPLSHSNAAATTASLLPKEVTTIEELRRALDAAPAVEVLDAMPHAITDGGVTSSGGEESSTGDVNTPESDGTRRLRVVSWDYMEDETPESDGEATGNGEESGVGKPKKRKNASGDGISTSPPASTRRHYQSVRVARYEDVSLLVTNLSVLPRDRHSLYRCYWRQYLKLVAPLLSFRLLAPDAAPEGQESASFTPALISSSSSFSHRQRTSGIWLSESYFNRIAAACQCNSFGVFSPADSCIASGLYPEASFFNHSCAPNLCRVMRSGRVACFYALRPIEKGEGLTICYTEVGENNTAERRRLLLDGYRFFCHCPRCGGQTGNSVPTAIYLCEKCEARGYLRPLRQGPATEDEHHDESSPSSPARVHTICSVCRQRTIISKTV